MTSANRTVTVPLPPAHLPCVQALVPALSWPDALPDAVLDYTADVAGWLADAGGVAMTSVALSIAPSGAGEMGCVSLDVTGGKIVAVLGPAPPGRGYLVRIKAVTNSPLRFEWVLGLNIVPIQAEYDPPSEPPSYGFGPPTIWQVRALIVPSQDFSTLLNSSVYYFDGGLTGGFTPFPPRPIVPSQNYSTGLNSSVAYFDGELTGPFTPLAPAYRPALKFNDARNAGLFMFRGRPAGPWHPIPPVQYTPSLDFSDLRNASLAYFGGQLTGGFTPL